MSIRRRSTFVVWAGSSPRSGPSIRTIATTPEDLCDWEKMRAVIADSEPWWEPGTRTAYHDPDSNGWAVQQISARG